MVENPLLPHRKLKELHALMLRCRALDRKVRNTQGAREALLAATSIHLQPGDVLCGTSTDLAVQELAPAGKTKRLSGFAALDTAERLIASCGIACGLKSAATDGVVLTFGQAGELEPGWKDALAWAQQEQLPLILACADNTGGAVSRSKGRSAEARLTWAEMSRFSSRTKLPILSVDGEDAVAVYRVMQESVLRARYGGGAAVIWALGTPQPKNLSRGKQPLTRLESYLKVRGIKV